MKVNVFIVIYQVLTLFFIYAYGNYTLHHISCLKHRIFHSYSMMKLMVLLRVSSGYGWFGSYSAVAGYIKQKL